jgi:hypothetical protein
MPERLKKLSLGERKARADALLEAHQRFSRMSPEERGPEGVTQVLLGRRLLPSRGAEEQGRE